MPVAALVHERRSQVMTARAVGGETNVPGGVPPGVPALDWLPSAGR